MSVLRFSLDWFVDQKGYRVDGTGNSRTIVPMGGSLRRIKPLNNDRLFLEFAQVSSDAHLLSFVHRYGLLESPGDQTDYGAVAWDPDTELPVPSRPVMFGESIKEHLGNAFMFARTLALIARKGRASANLSDFIFDRLLNDELGHIGWELQPASGITMKMTANTLLDGMLLQLAQEISTQPAFRICAYCKKPFAIGPNTERRAHAIFCSPDHKKLFHSRKRSMK